MHACMYVVYHVSVLSTVEFSVNYFVMLRRMPDRRREWRNKIGDKEFTGAEVAYYLAHPFGYCTCK